MGGTLFGEEPEGGGVGAPHGHGVLGAFQVNQPAGIALYRRERHGNRPMHPDETARGELFHDVFERNLRNDRR